MQLADAGAARITARAAPIRAFRMSSPLREGAERSIHLFQGAPQAILRQAQMPADGDAIDAERPRDLGPVHPLHLDEDEHGALPLAQERERSLQTPREVEALGGARPLEDVEVVAGSVPGCFV